MKINTPPNVNPDAIEPGEILITPDVETKRLRALASAVITQALRDMTWKNTTKQEKLNALSWFVSPEAEAWAYWAGRNEHNPYPILSRLETVKKLLKHGSTYHDR